MAKYKLLAIDLDGTLLSDDISIHNDNVQAIKKCLDSGVHVVITSGRSYLSIDKFLKILDIKKAGMYASSFHGSIIVKSDTLEVVHEFTLDRLIATNIINELDGLDVSDIGLLVYEGENLYTTHNNKNVEFYYNLCKVPVKLFNNISEIKGEISKIALSGDFETLQKFKEKIEQKKLTADCKGFYSHDFLLEYMNPNINKGKSLEFICDKLNVNIKDAIGVGDNYNDIELIKAAGLGVATNNAVDDLKKIADYVTIRTNNEGAIKEIVDKFII